MGNEKESKAISTNSQKSLTDTINFKKDFVPMMAYFTAHYPRMEISELEYEAMYHALRDLPKVKLKKGLRDFCDLHKDIYPGTNVIAYIREYALVDEGEFPEAYEAWQMVIQAMKRYGWYGNPNGDVCDDPIVMKAIRAMGWQDMCRSEDADVIRGQFLKIYKELIDKEKRNLIRRGNNE